MENEIAIEIIRIVPTLVWTVILTLVLWHYRRPLAELFSRVGRIKVLGVEAEFAQAREQLINASKSYDAAWNEAELRGVIERADRIRDLLKGARILWVDDHFLANANIFRFLHTYDVVVDSAATTEEAMMALRWSGGAYEVVVTDMVRYEDNAAGIHLIQEMNTAGIQKPVIVFVARLDPERGTPTGALAITDSPITLIHHILNVVEMASR
jgi:hypothetical protein